MKKVLMILFLFFLTLIMTSCNAYNQKFSQAESIAKFEFIELQLQEIGEKYGLTIPNHQVTASDSEDCGGVCVYSWYFRIQISETLSIGLSLENREGKERFAYFIYNYIDDIETAGTTISVDLLYDLVNTVSMRVFSTDFISDFLTAPESEYPIPWDKPEQYLIEKVWSSDDSNFNWGCTYHLSVQQNDGLYTEYLSIGGFIRA